jgi:mRNA interferase HicA
MKRRQLERHLRDHGCALHHHGAKHDVWLNPVTLAQAPVPRHNLIKRGTAHMPHSGNTPAAGDLTLHDEGIRGLEELPLAGILYAFGNVTRPEQHGFCETINVAASGLTTRQQPNHKF